VRLRNWITRDEYRKQLPAVLNYLPTLAARRGARLCLSAAGQGERGRVRAGHWSVPQAARASPAGREIPERVLRRGSAGVRAAARALW